MQRVTGRVYGDESLHDSLRGGPDSGFGVSIWVGPLSALSFNRGLATESGRGYQPSPPAFAAARLDAALEARGIRVRLKPRAGTAPAGSTELASVQSPPMQTLVRLMNKPSDNFFAEILTKDLAMQARGLGTTTAGARLAAGFARRLGARARLADGSGLSRGDRASPYRVVRLLAAMSGRPEYDAFVDSLAIAGQDGTLKTRMRLGAGPLALPRQDRNALERERAVRLLRGPDRRHVRLLDPDERGLPERRPRPAGPDAPGDRPRRAVATSNYRVGSVVGYEGSSDQRALE